MIAIVYIYKPRCVILEIFSDLTGVAGQVCDYCQATDVTLGAVVFLGQVLVGLSILILWYYVWYFKHSGLQPYNRSGVEE